MKQILNVLKNEIFNQKQSLNDLVNKVAIAQESFMNERSNDALYKIWSDHIKDLQKTESNLRHLRSAYVTMCDACEIEPLSNEEIVAEKNIKKNNRRLSTKKHATPKEEQQAN